MLALASRTNQRLCTRVLSTRLTDRQAVLFFCSTHSKKSLRARARLLFGITNPPRPSGLSSMVMVVLSCIASADSAAAHAYYAHAFSTSAACVRLHRINMYLCGPIALVCQTVLAHASSTLSDNRAIICQPHLYIVIRLRLNI